MTALQYSENETAKEGIAMANVKWIEDLFAAWQPFDEEKVFSFHTPDFAFEDVARGTVIRGHEAFRVFVKELFSGFPDAKWELLSSFESGDRACVEHIMTGTHKGDLPGLPATGKAISIRMAEVYELKDGKISKASEYYDGMTMLQQLGMLPPAPQG